MTTRHRFHALPLALILALAPASAAFAQQSISKVNGSITAEAGQEYGSLETVNGSIRIGAGARVRNAETVNGSIKAGNSARTGSLETVNGSIRLEEQVEVDGDLETVNGSIFVGRDGRIAEGIETVNGAIGLVAARVGGDIETVTGDLTVGAGSHVRGGIRYHKPSMVRFNVGKKQRPPRVIIGPNAVVEGPLVFEREVKLYVHTSARIGAITGATAIRYDTDRAPAE
ncbi:DUF4097 family beta strand repeat-containing protein [Marilutibacter alkalisoli]|uniref:Polymer-forming cytoskeletal protein n=1 Tax=Marilutibacter alkalisoli TaxID=2591633 RepID=A0A514BNB0_9GAMM|nr:hypothetical protein [Lysobacter alkalisoli]QDH68850.1 hypothetical protein FKV23_01060 [Lysobacter alkalisoli]